jgi:hypothetical protein
LSALEKIKSAASLVDLAVILGFTPKGLAYVLYKIEAENRYKNVRDSKEVRRHPNNQRAN